MLLDLVQPFLRATVSLEFAEISITNIPACTNKALTLVWNRSVKGQSSLMSLSLAASATDYGVLRCARRQTVAKEGSSERTAEEEKGKEEEERSRGRGQCGNS